MTDDTHKSDAADSEGEVKVDPLGRPETSDDYDPDAKPASEDEAYDAKAKPAE